jgi:prepilin-type N-terminal cleavage/methylation domain-containing protein
VACHGGFTLIEVLVVISVAALLVALLVPGLRGGKRSAGEAVTLSNLRQVHSAFEVYAQAHREVFPWAPEGFAFLVSGPGENPAYVQGGYWDIHIYWTALMHDAAPWPEFFPAWVGPGGVQSGERPWRRSNVPGEGIPSYQVSDTFFARPQLWMQGAVDDPGLYRPVRCPDVQFAASKVLAWDWEQPYLRYMAPDADLKPMVFADGHAGVKRLSDASPAPSIPFKPDTRPVQDTPEGVRGRDY